MLNIITSDRFLEHDTGLGHPECPERLTCILEALKKVDWKDSLIWNEPSLVKEKETIEEIKQIHPIEYIKSIEAISSNGGGYLDGDTPISSNSYKVALLAVRAWLDGVDIVGSSRNPAFVLARPPGHHAIKDRGMGFCLFSNAAITANYALKKPEINRVAILDWDVHHGNGTEAIVFDNPNIIYCSLHQSPCYPFTGNKSDRGKYNNVLNLPMSPGSTIREYQPIFEEEVIPFIKNFQPDILIVSAGYDANYRDPLAQISLQPEDYGLFTQELIKITRKILFGLEGGYNLDSLARSVVATLASCL